MKTRIKTNGAINALGIILTAIFPARFLRLSQTEFNFYPAIAAISLILFGFLLRISARGLKSEYSSGGNTLVRDGPYAMVRNPMYLGISAIALGVIVLLFQWWVLAVFAGFFIIRYITLIFKEEDILKENFGREYIDYANKVPRIIPNPAALIKNGIFRFLPLKLSWVKKELSSVLIVLLAGIGVKLWIINKAGEKALFSEAAAFTAVILLFLIFALVSVKKYENISKQNKNKR